MCPSEPRCVDFIFKHSNTTSTYTCNQVIIFSINLLFFDFLRQRVISSLHCFFANVTSCPLVLLSSLTDKKMQNIMFLANYHIGVTEIYVIGKVHGGCIAFRMMWRITAKSKSTVKFHINLSLVRKGHTVNCQYIQ